MSDRPDGIYVHGAREHNLKNIDVFIPRNQMTVVTGLSGSGKSSLCFDTVYAEGQRRYVESLSAYARNFLNQLKKPEVDSISGLSPAISIEQKTNSLSPRSTVGTVTEVNDYLRLLIARLGKAFCPTCDVPVSAQSPEQIVSAILAMKQGSKLCFLAPMASGKKGEFQKEFQKWLRLGYVRARVDGAYIELEKAGKLTKTKAHNIDLVVDRIILRKDIQDRILQSVKSALVLTKGTLLVHNIETDEIDLFSQYASCAKCGFNFPEIEPRLFSFNNPRGACEDCSGLGEIEVEVRASKKSPRSAEDDEEFSEFTYETCKSCSGSRLKSVARSVFLMCGRERKNISELSNVSSQELLEFFSNYKFSEKQKEIGDKIVEQILHRLIYIQKVGIDYLSMDRSAKTLSGGEAQRVRLSAQLGSSLIGVLYVLDEPSIGLHPRDHHRLLELLKEIRDHGNTVLMVEHDEDTIRNADLVIDLGPRAGKLGGHIQAVGTPEKISGMDESPTGRFLSGKDVVVAKRSRRVSKKFLTLSGASGNNLKNLELKIPTQSLVCVTGVSGSGKSTLIIDTLSPALSNLLYKSNHKVAAFKKITGAENFDKVVHITQSPIGRTPRSNPATYTGLMGQLRDLFSSHPESKLRGWGPGRFSFNVKGGRCETCQGAGQVKIEMHFMANVYVPCDDCNGRRYNFETLKVKYKEKSISDILSMTVEEACVFFKHHPQIYPKVATMQKVGLDYIQIGQSSTTLSGGEAQRVKLSKELSRRATGKTMYILDEPTTGLHFADTKKLIELLHALVEQGNTVLVIEHNLDVISASDYLIDLGPEGGRSGGSIVATGSPEEVAKNSTSLTGKFLKPHLRRLV